MSGLASRSLPRVNARRWPLLMPLLLLAACARQDSPTALPTSTAGIAPPAATTSRVAITPGAPDTTPVMAAGTTSTSPTPRGGTPGIAPSGTGRPLTSVPTAGAEVWERLRRPLRLPAIATGSPCPKEAVRTVDPAYGPAVGAGPVYAVGFGMAGVLKYRHAEEGGWFYQKVLFVVAPEYGGPVLVRGHQIDGPNEIRFDAGSDPPAEMRLPGGAGSGGWRNYPSSVRLRAAGCYAWQIDGADFSETIVFQSVE